jgi:4-amino-4-deoxy-L-arabinose transferase-like glycosyltransferase
MDRSSSSQTVSARKMLLLAAILLFLSALAGTAEPVSSLLRFIPKDYNEGWNAYWARDAWVSGILYPSANGIVVNNYPPLSFYIVGVFGQLVGDNIFAGRILALASLVVVTIGIYLWLRVAGLARTALVSAALFIAAFIAYAPGYVAMDDPQLIGHAFMVAAGFILWRRDFSTGALAIAALLTLLGGLTKHLLIPFPLAITVWIAIYRRDCLVRWLGFAGAFFVVALAIVAWRHVTLFHNIAVERTYSTHLAGRALQRLFRQFPLVLIISGIGVLFAPEKNNVNRRFASFTRIYFLLAALFGTIAATGEGVDRNAFFDLLIAAALAVGATLDFLLSRWARQSLTAVAVLLAALALPVALQAGSNLRGNLMLASSSGKREAAYLAEIAMIKEAKTGAAACEMLALCYWAGQPFAVDFFNYGQKLRKDLSAADECDQLLGNGSITILQVDAPRGGMLSQRLPNSCNQVIEDYFTPVLSTEFGVLLHRRTQWHSAPKDR